MSANRSVPAPVSTNERFVRLAVGLVAACGIRSYGQAWCWGSDEFGELGDGTTGLRRFPVQVMDP
jgi:alpha-tubulin suppressor-like RCC1 family protein